MYCMSTLRGPATTSLLCQGVMATIALPNFCDPRVAVNPKPLFFSYDACLMLSPSKPRTFASVGEAAVGVYSLS